MTVCLSVHSSGFFSSRDPACPPLVLLVLVFPTVKTATTMNLRSEHFAVPTVDTAKGSGRSGLPREAFFQ